MQWLIGLIVLIVAVAIVVAFMSRFYRKATREVALVRTGAGGKRVVVDGGAFVLPFLHRASEVNMKTLRLEVHRTGEHSLMTEDRLRIDVAVEFYLRVVPNPDGIATASQTLGSKTFRAAELQETIGGKLIGAIQGVAARQTMDSLHEDRAAFMRDVRDLVGEELVKNGLELESVALTQLDQTPFRALDDNNAFNAVGMRRLAEIVAQNKKQRAAIESDAEVAVRQSQLDATKRRLLIEQEEEQAQIEQRLRIETLKADQVAEIAEKQSLGELRAEEARINREREVRISEIAKDKDVQKSSLSARLDVDLAERDNAIRMAEKQSEEARAKATADRARAEAVAAAEALQTEKETAIAERSRRVSVIQAQEKTDVEAERLKSTTDTIRQEAEARAEADVAQANATRASLLAEAEGRAAIAKAENAISNDVIRMKVDMHRLDRLPDIVAQMVKPAEKIDTIRIHQISGLGGAGGGDATKPMVNQAIDGVLGMALQLPALKKLGEEIGLNLEGGIAGLADEAPKEPDKNEDEDDKDKTAKV